MAHDKITVDEPLISTDVDSLIHTLSDRKRISLEDLRQLCKIDKKTMEKWLAVLEDEGYINVEYGIRGTFVNWIGLGMESSNDNYVVEQTRNAAPEPDRAPEPPQPPITLSNKKDSVEIKPEPEEEPAEEKAVEAKEDSSYDSDAGSYSNSDSDAVDYAAEVNDNQADESDGPEPEELLSEYLARREEKGSIDVAELRATILNKLDMDDVPMKFGAPKLESKLREDADSAENESANDEHADDELVNDADSPSTPEAEVEDVQEEEYPAPSAPVQLAKDQTAVRELMNAYLSEINKEKEAIESLKKQKETLYLDKFSTIEGKMQSDVAVLSEKIIERQSRIAELKERVLELPDKVDDLNRLQKEMDRLKNEGRLALDRTKKKATEFITNITTSKSSIEERINEVTGVIELQSAKVQEFESMSASLDSKTERLREAMESAQSQVDEMLSTVSTLKSNLESVQQMKSDLSTMTDSIKSTVAGCGEELSALEAELEGIARMEHWVQEYVRDYEGKVEEIENYVTHSDDELAELKSAAESMYMKDYLNQLETMTEDYQAALSEAVSREQDIDQRIADSKARITDLVKESQDMIKRAKSGITIGSSEYNALLARVKSRTSRIKSVVVEKQGERNKLSEDTKNTRKTISSKPLIKAQAKARPQVKAKAKAKPASKSAKRRK